MHLAIPLFLLLALAAATPSPTPTPPPGDDDTVCPEGTIACGPVCVRANQRCCNDPFAADFWSCESAQTCGASRADGCRNPAHQQPPHSPSLPPSPSPLPPPSSRPETSRPSSTTSRSPPETPGPPATTLSSTETRTRTIQTRPTPTGADRQQPPTCFFEAPLARRAAPSEDKKEEAPCPTSLVSSDTPTEVPAETGAAAARVRSWGIAAVAAAAAGAVALLV